MRSAILRTLFVLGLAVGVLVGCETQPEQRIVVALVADGRERAIQQDAPITVGELLRAADIELGTLDEVNPPLFTQIADGMRITVARVQQTTECENQDVPFREQRILNEGLSAGEERLGQAGQNGVEQVCYRVTTRDGRRLDPVETSRTLVTAPQDLVIYVGPTGELDPVPIPGTLAYVSSGNAWIIRGNSTAKRPLTDSADIDPRVFRLSADGRQLLFARIAPQAQRAASFNRLWLLADTTRDAPPVALVPENVLYADWVPGAENTISYSTGEPRTAAPGWESYNDLWLMRIDPVSGASVGLRQLVENSQGGLYGWWGTEFQWSPDGSRLAWSRADSTGIVNLDTGDLIPVLTYPVFNTRQSWSWRASVSWTPDASLMLTTIHGDPIGSEPAESSPAFHVAAADPTGTFSVSMVENAGIWSMPRFSPFQNDGTEVRGAMAYLKARDLSNSINEAAEYDLMLADRDGSNARAVFPPLGQPGVTAAAGITWSPDGTMIAFIYQGNLWVIDVISDVAHQLTLDGRASRPVWTR
jgi:Tol biopolymer transport system component